MSWLVKAADIGITATKIGFHLWHVSGMNKQDPVVKLNKKFIGNLGVSRQTRYRALNDLANAGLITIEQKNGHYPEVTLIFRSSRQSS